MDHDAILTALRQAIPDIAFEPLASVDGQPTIVVSRDVVPALARRLRDHPDLAFTCLAEVTAVDCWPREPRFEVVYLLISIPRRVRLRIKVWVHGGDARIATVTDVWPSANWLEREVWDMFGIAFDGHPDPRRLLMPEDWEGFPLRKDYPVQIRKETNAFEPLQISEEEFRRSLNRDRLTRT
jgi:NADH-quinone oxidoreductase subunit C